MVGPLEDLKRFLPKLAGGLSVTGGLVGFADGTLLRPDVAPADQEGANLR